MLKELSSANFNNLIDADEALDLDNELADRQADSMGRIRINIERVASKKLAKPRNIKKSFYNPLASTSCAKDLVKDRHIGHAMV